MSFDHLPDDVAGYNEQALKKLAWAIAASSGQFKLLLARCNHTCWRQQLADRLQQLCRVEIPILQLTESDKTLHARIREEFTPQQPAALMVFGLEAVGDLDLLLTSTNQVREEFPKNFHFPLVLWVNDEVLKKLIRIAPDFESWAITTEFKIPPAALTNFLSQTAEQWFANTLHLTPQACLELKAALQDLPDSGGGLDTELQANLESLQGGLKFLSHQNDAALKHYQKALELWQQTNNLARLAKLVSEIGLCYYLKAVRREITSSDWQEYWDYLRQYIEVFERAERPDLVANSSGNLCKVLRQLERWDELRSLAEKALAVQPTENNSVELARYWGFLGEVALAKQDWTDAKDKAERALEVISRTPKPEPQAISYDSSLYRFILAQSQEHLNQPQDAIANLEEARKKGSPEYDTQLYLDILAYLQKLYFAQKQYLEAFQIKLERQSIEQQYGLRAFVGAGRIKPQRAEKFALAQVENQESVPPEIAASGRMLDVERLIKQIGRNDCKLIVIHGQSGVGKSSLVNGGLVPTLKKKIIGTQDVLPVLVRVYTNWVAELGRLLKEALAEKNLQTPDIPSYEDTKAILAQLRQNEHRHLRTVLIFDQFEEFFFFYTTGSERKRFFEFLGECLNILPLTAILSLREDYLHYLLECDRLDCMNIIEKDILSKKVRYSLGNFSPTDAEAIIQRLTERAKFNLEDVLIKQLVQELAGELGEVRPIELQIVGAQLQAEKITTLAQYRERGPKEEFVKRYLAEVVTDCGTENKQVAELVLYLLTDEKGTRPLKTRAELQRDLQAIGAKLTGDFSKLNLVLEIFVGASLVLLLPEKPERRYQLVHDYLAAFIHQQQQPKLNELIAELEKEREQRQLAEQARQILEKANQKAKQLIRFGTSFLIASLVVAVGAGVWASRTLEEARKVTILEREGVNALRQFEFQQIEALLTAMQTGQELKALVKDNSPLENYPTRSPFLALQTILDQIWERTQLKGHRGKLNSASFSPDGKQIVTASYDNTARVWDLSGQLVKELKGHQDAVNSASFSPDGKQIVTASEDQTARVWDLSGKLVKKLKGHQSLVESASFSPDGKQIVTASADNTARVWDLSGKLVKELKGHQSSVMSASFSPDGKQIVTASWDKTARVWDLSGKLVKELKGHQGAVRSASFSPDGKQIVTASDDNTARVWDLSGQVVKELKGPQIIVFSASFSPDGKQIVTASWDNTARVWDLSGQVIKELKGHQDVVISASFSPDGKQIVTASADKTARVWDLSGQQVKKLKGHQREVHSASFSPDGKQIVTVSDNQTARVWDLSGKLVKELKGHQLVVNSASFSPDGKQIVTASNDNTARVWDLSGQQVKELKGHQSAVYRASFSPDGKQIVITSNDNMGRVWDLSGQVVKELKGHQYPVNSASFSPDGKQIVTASWDNTARVWDLSGQVVTELEGHQDWVNSASFSPDGKQIVTASRDKTARVWDLSGQLIKELKGHQGEVNSASFSPDGKQIVTASWDNTARVWDLSGQVLAELEGHQDRVNSASFSPDGKQIVTASDDNTARVWRVGSLDDLLPRGCNWLNDYLVINPKELQKLEVCQNKSNLTAAAPFLVEEGEEQARKGNIDAAVATFQTALKWNSRLNFAPEAKAQQLAEASNLVKKGNKLVEEGDIEGAVKAFQRAMQLDPSSDFEPYLVLIWKGEKLVMQGKVKEALAAYAQAQKFAGKVAISARSWYTLCWYGSLHGAAADVMFACEKAVAIAPYNVYIRDSRGLARALTGNTKGAIEDFQAYLAPTYNENKKSRRQRWINALKAGKNPFTAEEVKSLLSEDFNLPLWMW